MNIKSYYSKLLIIVSIFYFSSSLLKFFLPIYFDDLGFSGFEIGLFYALLALAGIVSAFHSGLFNDRYGSRIIMAIGIFLFSTYLLTLSFTSTFIIFAIAFFLGGLGHNIFHISSDSYILKKVINRKGFKYGCYSGLKSLMSAISKFFAGFLLTFFLFNEVLFFLGLFILISIIIIYKLPRTKISFQKVNLYFNDIKHKKTIIFLILLFIFTLHWGVEYTSYSLFLKHNLNLSMIEMGLYMSIPVIFLSLFAVLIGHWYDKGLTHKKIFFIAFILSGLGLFMMAFFNDPYISFIFRIIHEIGDGAFIIFMLIGTSSYFPKARIGGGYGFVTLTLVISQMVGALIFSPIGHAYGYHIPHLIVGALIFFSGFLVFLIRR